MSTAARDVERFSRRAGHYERSGHQRFIGVIHDAMIECAAAAARPPETVLDVGCGTGRFLRKAAQRWPAARLIGVDPAEGMLAEARRQLPAATFSAGTAEALPVAPESIDLAVSSISLHHWADAKAGIAGIARTLRPGGVFCLADITMKPWLSRLLRSRARSASELRGLFESAELAVLDERRVLARLILVLAGRRPEAAA